MYKTLAGKLPAYRLQIMACITAFDEGVANITKALRQKQLWPNTVFVFQSDK